MASLTSKLELYINNKHIVQTTFSFFSIIDTYASDEQVIFYLSVKSGSLKFIAKRLGEPETLMWMRSGTQGNKWRFADLTFNSDKPIQVFLLLVSVCIVRCCWQKHIKECFHRTTECDETLL